MLSRSEHGIVLVASGLVALLSLSLPWMGELSLLQRFGVVQAERAIGIENVRITGDTLSLIALDTMFYTAFLASAFLIAVGLVQYLDESNRVEPVRRLGIGLYAISVLAIAYDLSVVGTSPARYGAYVFSGIVVVLLLAEYWSESEARPRAASPSSQ